jgi:putative membrane protein
MRSERVSLRIPRSTEVEIPEFSVTRHRRAPTPARFALVLAINALALWIANGLFAGVRIDGWEAYLVGAVVLAIANTLIKPVLAVLTLPLILATLGFFLLLINMAMVAFTAWITPDFTVDGFWTYAGVVVVFWLVNWAGNAFVERTAGVGR